MKNNDYQLVTVAIVDDHKMVVKGFSKLINDSNVATVTQVYYDITSCREGLKKALPDILLLDIGLPDGDGVEFCGEITKMYPRLKIIMLTSYKQFNVAKRALSNGALGYILKNSEPEEIFAGIEAVNRGEQFLCEEIDILLKDKLDTKVTWFSHRELEILQFIANGLTSGEIAQRIFRDDETVKSHRQNLLIKLEAGNTPLMIRKACEQNLIRLNQGTGK